MVLLASLTAFVLVFLAFVTTLLYFDARATRRKIRALEDAFRKAHGDGNGYPSAAAVVTDAAPSPPPPLSLPVPAPALERRVVSVTRDDHPDHTRPTREAPPPALADERILDLFLVLVARSAQAGIGAAHCKEAACTDDVIGICACPCDPCARRRQLHRRAEQEVLGAGSSRTAADVPLERATAARGRLALLPPASDEAPASDRRPIPLEAQAKLSPEQIERVDALADLAGVTRDEMILELLDQGTAAIEGDPLEARYGALRIASRAAGEDCDHCGSAECWQGDDEVLCVCNCDPCTRAVVLFRKAERDVMGPGRGDNDSDPPDSGPAAA